MKIIADANIPFVAECFSSIGEVKAVGGREITPDVVCDADVLLVRSITQVNSDLFHLQPIGWLSGVELAKTG